MASSSLEKLAGKIASFRLLGLGGDNDGKDGLGSLFGLLALTGDKNANRQKRYLRRKRRDRGGGSEGAYLAIAAQVFGVLNQVGAYLAGVAAGPKFTDLGLPSTYSLSNWGAVPANDSKVIQYLINTDKGVAASALNGLQAVRSEAEIALQESFDGDKPYGRSSQTAQLFQYGVLLQNPGYGVAQPVVGAPSSYY